MIEWMNDWMVGMNDMNEWRNEGLKERMKE